MTITSLNVYVTIYKSSDMLNKNILGIKKCEANQQQQCYKQPKTLISSKAKKLNIIKNHNITIVCRTFSQLPYSGLILRGEIFVDFALSLKFKP